MIIALVALTLTACATSQSPVKAPEAPIVVTPPQVAPEAPAPQEPVVPAQPEAEKPYPVTGWDFRYDKIVSDYVETLPELITQPEWRFAKLCPKWSKLDIVQKKQFWADLLYAVTKPESNYDRSTMFWESTMDKDVVTGLPVVSEGLLQMSYQDGKWYEGCKFDYKKDREKFIADWNNRGGKKSWKSKHVDRTTLDPVINLKCGAYVSWRIMKAPKHSSKSAEDALGEYWLTIRPNKDLNVVVSQLKQKAPQCF